MTRVALGMAMAMSGAEVIQVSESDRPGMKSWPYTETAGTHFLHLYVRNNNACLEGFLAVRFK